jgi:hypothetical protein
MMKETAIRVLIALLMTLLSVGCSSAATPAAPPAATSAPPAAAKPTTAPGGAATTAAAATVAAPAAAPTSAPAPTAAPAAADFRNRTVHIIVGYAPGGGFDANARLLAPLLSQALPGNPTVVVENQPGADSLLAARTVLTGPARGNDVNIVVYIATLLARSALSGGIDGFAPEEQSIYLGKPDAAPTQIGICASSKVVSNLDEFLARSEPLKVSGLNGTSYYDSLLRWVKEVGYPIDVVFGYAGTSAMALAFNQGEVDATPSCRDQDLAQNPDWLDNGQLTPLFYFEQPAEAIKKLQAQGKFPWYRNVLDVRPVTPDQQAVLKTWLAINQGSNVYAISKQTPPDVARSLQQAFKQVVTSNELMAQFQSRQLQVGYMAPEEIDRTVKDLGQASPAARELMKKLLGS